MKRDHAKRILVFKLRMLKLYRTWYIISGKPHDLQNANRLKKEVQAILKKLDKAA